MTTVSVADTACLLQGATYNPEFRVTKYTSTPGNHNHIAVLDVKFGPFEYRRLLERKDQARFRTVSFPAVRRPKNADNPWLPLIIIADRVTKRRFDEHVLAAIDAYLTRSKRGVTK